MLSHYATVKENIMKHLQINAEVSDRLRQFVTQRFQARGRFNELETLSGISASKWKNFFYKKQEATQELLHFWSEKFSDDSLYPSGNQFIDLLPSTKDVSARLRELIEQKFQSRGRFSSLEKLSGINESKWKSFFYGKQGATQELLQFWCEYSPESANWLLNGVFTGGIEGYPFTTPSPTLSETNLANRLIWAISEWASPQGEQLFKYLSQKSMGMIKPDEWGKMMRGSMEPSIQMIEVVCKQRPYFSEWIITGHAKATPQVDPTDSSSIKKWNEHMKFNPK